MNATPIRPEVFLLTDEERHLVADGPALTGPDGTQHGIPPKVHAVMKYVEDALRQGYALQIIPRRHELPIDEAADAVSMPREELRLLVSQGEIPFRSSEYVDWVRLSDAIAVSNRLDAEREKMLQSFAEEEPWDDDTPGNG